MTIEEILQYHAKSYPSMRPADAVKLLYQNEFGGGHLIENPARSLEWLEAEYKEIQHNSSQPLLIPIGNGLVRYNLHAIDTKIMSLTRLNEIFVESSHIVTGSLGSFHAKLNILVGLTNKQRFAFSLEELQNYLQDYKKQGYSPVSHSQEFRKIYAPAYRVVLDHLLRVDIHRTSFSQP